jgi:hypothetical protein
MIKNILYIVTITPPEISQIGKSGLNGHLFKLGIPFKIFKI